MPDPERGGPSGADRLYGSERENSHLRTGLVIQVDNLGALTDPQPFFPLKGISVSPKTLGKLFSGDFKPATELDERTIVSPDGGRRESVLTAAVFGAETGEVMRVSHRSLEQIGPVSETTQLHSSARRRSNFEAIYVPQDEDGSNSAVLTYPRRHEQATGGYVSYGDVVEIELSGALVVLPGGIPYDIRPANGHMVTYMHATNDTFGVGNSAKVVRHLEALNTTESGEIDGGRTIFALGHDIGIGRNVTGIRGDESEILREPNPEVVKSDIVDTRNLVPDTMPVPNHQHLSETTVS